MPGGIDQQRDLALTAVAAVVRSAIRADISPEALAKVYADPRPPGDFDENDLPCLCVYRQRERWERRSSTRRVRIITVAFDYTLPSAASRPSGAAQGDDPESPPDDERTARWPALQAVWDALCTAVVDGNGDDAFEAAAVFALENSPDVRYELAGGGRESDAQEHPRRPTFRGTIQIEHESAAVDPLTLDKFLSLHASYDLVQTDQTQHTPSQPGVSTDEGPVETNLPDFAIADIVPGAD